MTTRKPWPQAGQPCPACGAPIRRDFDRGDWHCWSCSSPTCRWADARLNAKALERLERGES
jgi:hypothetical protein